MCFPLTTFIAKDDIKEISGDYSTSINLDNMYDKALAVLNKNIPDTVQSINSFEPLKDKAKKINTSFIGKGYYTILINPDYTLSAISITFPMINNGINPAIKSFGVQKEVLR